MVSHHFAQVVATNVAYWQNRVYNLTDAEIPRLAPDHPNLLRAAEFGQVLPATQPAVAELILHAFPLIERCGHWELWLPLLDQAITASNDDALPRKGKLLNCRGLLLRRRPQFDQAIAAHEEARRIAIRLNAPQAVAEADFNLSETYRLRRDYAQAEAYGLAALDTFTHLPGVEKWLASTLNTLGLTARELGQLETSAQRLEQAVALWRQLEQPTELGRTLNNLANTLQAQKKYAAALTQFQAAADVLASTASELDKSKVLLSLGNLHYQLEQFDQAEDAIRQADSPALRQSGDSYLRAVFYLNLGSVVLKQQRPEEAEGYLRQSLIFWRQTEHKRNLANACGTLAEALAAQGKGREARLYFDEAIGLLESYLGNLRVKNLPDPWAEYLLKKLKALRRE